jgi:uncharacterized protein YjiK
MLFRELMQVKKILFCILSLAALSTILHLTGLDDRIFRALISLNQKETFVRQVIWLNDYILAKNQRISCLEDELSGITYSSQTKTLFIVTDDPPKIYNIDKSGRCLREIFLRGFHDTEGIVHLGGNRFAIVEEEENIIKVVEISDTTTIIDRTEVINSLQMVMKNPDTKGFEGVAYDEVKQRIYLVNEKRPKQLIAIDGLVNKGEKIRIKIDHRLLPRYLFMDDLSGLHFDTKSRHLLFLSHESNLVAEGSLDGEVVSYMELKKGYSGLKNDVLKAEGITMDDDGNIYIVGEPNLFYQFVRKD